MLELVTVINLKFYKQLLGCSTKEYPVYIFLYGLSSGRQKADGGIEVAMAAASADGGVEVAAASNALITKLISHCFTDAKGVMMQLKSRLYQWIGQQD